MIVHTFIFIITVLSTMWIWTSVSRQIDYAKRMRQYHGFYVYDYDKQIPYIILNAVFYKSGINTRVRLFAYTRRTDWFSLLCLSPKLIEVTVSDSIIPPSGSSQEFAIQLAQTCIEKGSTFLTQFRGNPRIGFRIYDAKLDNMLSAFTLQVDAGDHGSSPCR